LTWQKIPHLSNHTRISYAGDTSSDIALKALNYEKENEKVAFSGGHFKLDADRDGNVFSLTGEAESGLVNAVNEYNQKFSSPSTT
jgi:uncharacterized protein YdgA (DUF945 family)